MVKSNPDIFNLPEPPKHSPSYMMVKNGTVISLFSTAELLSAMATLKKKDEVLIRDCIGEMKAPICIKFSGSNTCISSPFFADMTKKQNPQFTYIPFGINRTQDDFQPYRFKDDLYDFTYYNNVTLFDKWFQKLWYQNIANPNEGDEI